MKWNRLFMDKCGESNHQLIKLKFNDNLSWHLDKYRKRGEHFGWIYAFVHPRLGYAFLSFMSLAVELLSVCAAPFQRLESFMSRPRLAIYLKEFEQCGTILRNGVWTVPCHGEVVNCNFFGSFTLLSVCSLLTVLLCLLFASFGFVFIRVSFIFLLRIAVVFFGFLFKWDLFLWFTVYFIFAVCFVRFCNSSE